MGARWDQIPDARTLPGGLPEEERLLPAPYCRARVTRRSWLRRIENTTKKKQRVWILWKRKRIISKKH